MVTSRISNIMMIWESFFILVGQILILYLTFYYTQYFLRRKKSPPGPFPLPVLGNVIQVASAHPIGHLAIYELSKRYGSVYQIRLGPTDTVVLASLTACKAILNNDAALGRDLSGLIKDRSLGQDIGMAFSSVERWSRIRPWTMKNLKSYGLRKKSSVESAANTAIVELTDIINEVVDTKDGVFEANFTFNITAVNIIWEVMTGHRILKGDKRMQNLMEDQDACLKSSALSMALIGTYPPLRHVFPGLLGYNLAIKFYTGFVEVVRELLHEEVKKIGIEISDFEPSNLLQAYICQMHAERENPRTLFTEDNLAVLYLDLFQGGSETTGGFMEWLVLFMAVNPDKQKKLQEEIDSVLPDMESCSYSHKPMMVYTQALILETHRHAPLLPNGVPRRVTADIEYDDFVIRKGSNIIIDFHAINNDVNSWGSDTEKFRPERFISSEGKIVNADKLIPFSYGRRNCPGESLSDVISFLMVVNLFQRFTFSTIPNTDPLTIEPMGGFTARPHPYKVTVERRN